MNFMLCDIMIHRFLYGARTLQRFQKWCDRTALTGSHVVTYNLESLFPKHKLKRRQKTATEVIMELKVKHFHQIIIIININIHPVITPH